MGSPDAEAPKESGPRGRGGAWVAAQVAFMAAVGLSALAGPGWPPDLETAGAAVGGLLVAAGLLLLVAGGFRLGASLTPFPAPRTGAGLVTSGIYARVRHPMYGGGLLVALGWSILFGSAAGVALTAAFAVFLDRKARREEVWLAERYAGYAEYRRRTRRRLLPFVY